MGIYVLDSASGNETEVLYVGSDKFVKLPLRPVSQEIPCVTTTNKISIYLGVLEIILNAYKCSISLRTHGEPMQHHLRQMTQQRDVLVLQKLMAYIYIYDYTGTMIEHYKDL